MKLKQLILSSIALGALAFTVGLSPTSMRQSAWNQHQLKILENLHLTQHHM